MVNFPLEYCPYCGTELEVVEWPKYFRCESCDDWIFHNSVLGTTVVVVDGDRMLLVEDFRTPGAWKPPQGRPEIPESPREGAARELEEETGLSVDPAALIYFFDIAAEPVEDQYMTGIYYAVDREDTTGVVEAGSDATDAQFWRTDEFADSDRSVKAMPNPNWDPFWYENLELLLDMAQLALEREIRYSTLVETYRDRLSSGSTE